MPRRDHLSWRRRRSSTESPTPRDPETTILGIAEALVERGRVWHLLTVLPVRQRAGLSNAGSESARCLFSDGRDVMTDRNNPGDRTQLP